MERERLLLPLYFLPSQQINPPENFLRRALFSFADKAAMRVSTLFLPSLFICKHRQISVPQFTFQYTFASFFERILLHNSFIMKELEARDGIEPSHRSFADSCLTTWLPRRKITLESYRLRRRCQSACACASEDNEGGGHDFHIGSGNGRVALGLLYLGHAACLE